MPSSKIDEMTQEDLELALSQVQTKVLIAAAEVDQLISRAFEDPERAHGQLMNLVASDRVERAVEVLGGEHQHWHLGPQKRPFLGFLASRDPDVKAALVQLPDALRRLTILRGQSAAMQTALRSQSVRRDDAEMRRKLGSSDESAQVISRKPDRSLH
jgi:hypothetical protein